MSTTAVRAVDVAWPDFEALAAKVMAATHKGRHIVTWPGSSRTFITGADRIGLFDRKRGIKGIVFVHLDECQDWESATLEYAVTKVFAPRLGDMEKRYGVKGRILLTGTGAKQGTFWHKACSDPELGFGVTAGITQWDNPHIADPEGEFIEACRLAKVPWRRLETPVPSLHGGRPRWVDTEDSMTRREWFAEFNSGGSRQVFQGRPVMVSRSILPTRDVGLVVTADYGTVDKCAVGAWLYSRHDPRPYLVELQRQTGLSASRQVAFVRQWAAVWRERYKPAYRPFLVGDGGGLGKALIMDLQEAEGAWDVEPAEKQDKVPNIRILAGDMRDGSWALVDDLAWFADLLQEPEWDPDYVGEKLTGHMPDEIDCAYMGYRKVKMLHTLAPPEKPALDEAGRMNAALEKEKREGAKRSTRDNGLRQMGGRSALAAWKR